MKFAIMNIIWFVVMGFCSCNHEIVLNDLPIEFYNAKELPDSVFKCMRISLLSNYNSVNNNSMKRVWNTSTGDHSFVINISNDSIEYWSNYGGAYSSDQHFIVNGIDYNLKYGGNVFNEPFVYFDNKLYFRRTMNVNSEERFNDALFGSFNIHP